MEVAGLTIVDELGTPDSSRFTIKEDWLQAMQDGRAPQFWDKQPVRDWGATVPTPFVYQEGDKKGEKIIGIKNLDPENPEHVAFVHSLEVPSEVISQASERYQQIFKKITGNSLQEYQKSYMGFNDKY
jgi:phosphoribosylaminoimidazole-succinocarboxamide synthase